MSSVARLLLRAALRLAPAQSRTRLEEQWGAELLSVRAFGMSPFRFALGLVVAAARLRLTDHSRRARAVAILASFALLVTGGSITFLMTPRPVCATTRQVLGEVEGDRMFDRTGPLPERAQAAMRAIRLAGGYEGLWVDARGNVTVGVYGPRWEHARAAAVAVAKVPGPAITYVCQPTTQRDLAAAQDALDRSPLWRSRQIGFSDIDTENATVVVAIVDTAPAGTESDLQRRYGPRLRITRSRAPIVDMAPGRGRMPIDEHVMPKDPAKHLAG